MLDFDYVCQRKEHSVKAMVYPFRYIANVVLNVVTETYYVCSFKEEGKNTIWKFFKVNIETTKVTSRMSFKTCRFLFKVKKKTWTTSMDVLLVSSFPAFNMYLLTRVVYLFQNGYFSDFVGFFFRHEPKRSQK